MRSSFPGTQPSWHQKISPPQHPPLRAGHGQAQGQPIPAQQQPLDLATQWLAREQLPGRLGRLQHTIDPDVRRCPLIVAGRIWALIYINLSHQSCTLIRRGQPARVQPCSSSSP